MTEIPHEALDPMLLALCEMYTGDEFPLGRRCSCLLQARGVSMKVTPDIRAAADRFKRSFCLVYDLVTPEPVVPEDVTQLAPQPEAP